MAEKKSPRFVLFLGIAVGSLLLMGFTALNLSAPENSQSFVSQIDDVCEGHQCLQETSPTGWNSSPPTEVKSASKPKPASADFPFTTNSMQAQVMRVADLYESQMHYPKYSYPINTGNLDQFIPNQHIASALPLVGTGLGENASLTLNLDKFNYFWGDTIVPVAALVLGENDPQITSARFTLISESGKTMATVEQPTIKQTQVIAEIPLSTVGTSDEQDYFLVADVSSAHSGDRYEVRTSLRIGHMVGEITGVEKSDLEGSHLLIPVELSLEDEGYYLISANLYSEQGEPLLNLSHKGKLSKYDDQITLKAHYSALSASGNEGPYKLGNFELKKLPSKPGDSTGFGKVPDSTFSVNGFPFKEFDQTPYSNPQAEARVEFLRTLSNAQG